MPGFFGVLEQGERNHHVRMDRWLGIARPCGQQHSHIRAGGCHSVRTDRRLSRRFRDAQLERLTTCAEHVNPSARNPQVMRGCCVEYQDAVGAAQSLIPASHDGIPSD